MLFKAKQRAYVFNTKIFICFIDIEYQRKWNFLSQVHYAELCDTSLAGLCSLLPNFIILPCVILVGKIFVLIS